MSMARSMVCLDQNLQDGEWMEGQNQKGQDNGGTPLSGACFLPRDNFIDQYKQQWFRLECDHF